MSTDDRNVRFTTEVGLILDDVELEIELAYLSYAIRMGRTELHYVPERLEVAPLDADVAKALASAGYEPRVGGELDDGTPTLDIDLRRRPPAVRLQAAVPRWVVLGGDAAPLPESTQPFNINWSGSVLDVRSPAMIEIDGEPLCQALICCAVDMDIRDYGIKDVWFNPTECRLRQPLSAEHVARIERSGAVVRGNGREVDLTGALGVSCRIASSEHAFSLAVQTLHFRSVRRGRAEHPVVSRSSAIQSGAALERVEIQFAEPPAALASRSAEKLVDAFETTPDPNLAAALAIELGAGPATSTEPVLRAALADVTEDAFVKLNAIWALGALRPWRARSPEQWGELLEELVTSSESPSLVKQAGVALSECAPARRSWLARVAASKEPRLSSLAFWLRDGARKRDCRTRRA